MDAIFKFHKCGFETCAVVNDGASSNLTMIKELVLSGKLMGMFVLLKCLANYCTLMLLQVPSER